ncbi:MAG TPA: MFS transporter, partial [Oscillospiraceae bacterium]|nr:MFS transporter [Oscillospiraceae bacterium]
KMLDMAGSSFGVIFAYFFVATNFGFHRAFLFSIIPAIVSILIILAIKEEKTSGPAAEKLNLKGLKLNGKLKIYLAVIFIFCLGNSSNTFLLLKAQENGFSSSEVILLYLVFNVSASLLAIPAGKLSDKLGRSKVLVPGYLIYGLVYLGFAFLSSRFSMILLFIAYGAYNALISGAERAFIVENSPKGLKGTILGLYGMLQGIGLLLSSIIAGLMWDNVNSAAPFIFGGILGIISALLIQIIFCTGRAPRDAAA